MSLVHFSHLAELPENWTDTRETLLEGMVFHLKYLGVTMVEQPKGEELSAAAVKRIVATVRGTNLHTFSGEDITQCVYMHSRNQVTVRFLK